MIAQLLKPSTNNNLLKPEHRRDGTIVPVLVRQICRRPSVGAYSIEKLFSEIGKNFSGNVKVELRYEKFISKGFLKRVINGIYMTFQQGDVNHILGHAHYLAIFLKPGKTILTVHDCVFMQHPNPIARFVLWFFWLYLPVKWVRYVTVISEYTKKEVLKYVSGCEHKIKVIPDCIPGHYTFDRKKTNNKTPRLLLIGTKANKNLERVILATSRIHCKLEIIGKLSAQQKLLLQEENAVFSNSYNLTEEELMRKYQKSDLLLFCSTAEGFGMPILEAQALGIPVITSNCSSMPEVAGEGAHFVNPFDIEDINKGIIEVIENDTYREKLISKGLENQRRFAPKRVAALYEQLYLQII